LTKNYFLRQSEYRKKTSTTSATKKIVKNKAAWLQVWFFALIFQQKLNLNQIIRRNKKMKTIKKAVKKLVNWLKSGKLSRWLIKKPYRDVCFRLKSGCKTEENVIFGRSGWGSAEEMNSFYNEICVLFMHRGWKIIQPEEKYYFYPEAVKGKSRLCFYPRKVTGEIKKSLIKEVKEILLQGNLFVHHKTELFEEIADMTDDEYMLYLIKRRKNIKKDIRRSFRLCARYMGVRAFWKCLKNSFVRKFKLKKSINPDSYVASHILEKVSDTYRIKRLQEHEHKNYHLELDYVYDVFDKMVANGEIIETQQYIVPKKFTIFSILRSHEIS
jgi:hypothetical protein